MIGSGQPSPGRRGRSRRRDPVQDRARSTVDRILAAARALLVTGGPEAFTTNRVAAAAGLGVGSVYEYFADKQSIVDRLIDDLADAEGAAVLELLARRADAPLEALIGEVVDLTCRLYDQNAALYRVLWALSERARAVGRRPAERAILADLARRLAPRAAELGIADVPLACFTVFHLVEALAGRMAEQGRAWPAAARSREIGRAVAGYLGLG